MRPESEYRTALSLIESGINDSAVARQLGIPRSTIRDWRRGRWTAPRGQTTHRTSGSIRSECFRCRGDQFDQEAYAYLLGVYLGDGSLSEGPRKVFRLRVTCDLRYPNIIDEVATHIVIVRGVDRVGFFRRPGCVDVIAYWKHWQCVFPQHGPGRKHTRRIELEGWQDHVVASHPKALIRGLIHTDGNRHVNVVTKRLSAGWKKYRYPRYMFTNRSDDIRRILTGALDSIGVNWTKAGPYDISIATRDDVAFLDAFVGPKT
jgi:hypothetical protein